MSKHQRAFVEHGCYSLVVVWGAFLAWKMNPLIAVALTAFGLVCAWTFLHLEEGL